MRWKSRLSKDCRLYLILDAQVNTYDELFEITKKIIHAGVDIVQLRDKFGSAKAILEFSRKIQKVINGRIPFILNDRVDLAKMIKAGVHLGQEDISVNVARKMLGPKVIIGASCQSLEHALRAEVQGADYIGFGSVFKTKTKPERSSMDLTLLSKVVQKIRIPVFAIGGINLKNIRSLKALGIQRVAVCRAICRAQDCVQAAKCFDNILRG